MNANVTARRIVLTCAAIAVLCALAANAVYQVRQDDQSNTGSRTERQLREGAEPTAARLAACTTHPCMEAWYERYAAVRGADLAIARLDATMAAGKLGAADCHGVMHAIGIGSLQHVEDDAAQAMAVGNESCASGYYHGVLGAAFAGRDLDTLPDYAAKLCGGSKFTAASGPIEQCAHGIGHGFMGFTGNDLPAALSTCERLGGSLVDSCAGGALMENWGSIDTPTQSRWIRADDMQYPCQVIGDRHQFQCYSQLVGRMRASNAGWDQVAKECSRLPDAFRSACFDSLGANAQSSTANDPDMTMAACSATERFGGAGDCVHGAAAAMVGFDGTTTYARRLCDAVSDNQRPDCARGIGRSLANVPGRIGPARGCASLARQDRDACLTAARHACAQRWATGAGCTPIQLGRSSAGGRA